MKKDEIKKIFVNGVLATGFCIGATSCSAAQAKIESSETKETVSSIVSETAVTTVPTSEIEIIATEESTTTLDSNNSVGETTIMSETTVEAAVTTAPTVITQEATTTTPVETTNETTTVASTSTGELTAAQVKKISNDYTNYLKKVTKNLDDQTVKAGMISNFSKSVKWEKIPALVFAANEQLISKDVYDELVASKFISSDIKKVNEDCCECIMVIASLNATYIEAFPNQIKDQNIVRINSLFYDKKYKDAAAKCENDSISYVTKNGYASFYKKCKNQKEVTTYAYNSNFIGPDYCIRTHSIFLNYLYCSQAPDFSKEYRAKISTQIEDTQINYKNYMNNKYTNSKQKVLTNN